MFLISLLLLQPPTLNVPATPWIMDEVKHTNGSVFRGLILNESNLGIEFQVVIRRVGRPTLTLTTFFKSSEITQTIRLNAEARAELLAKIKELDPGGEGERQRMESISLIPYLWLGKEGAGWSYTSERFIIRSGATDSLTRRAAVRVEQLFATLERYFPMPNPEALPIIIELATNRKDYLELLPAALRGINNPAVFLAKERRIVCGSDLEPLDLKLNKIKAAQRGDRQKLDDYEKYIRTMYKNSRQELERYLLIVANERQRIREADRKNELAMTDATRRYFALLAHEVLHALMHDARSAQDHPFALPRFLEEGLAQLCETAILEGGELRIDHADEARLMRMKERLQKPAERFRLGELLRSSANDFVSQHDQKERGSELYLASWAFTFYLLHERQALQGEAFTTYIKTLREGGDPIRAAEIWLGEDMTTLEATWWKYIAALTPQGKPMRVGKP